jgi:hypothetical protein
VWISEYAALQRLRIQLKFPEPAGQRHLKLERADHTGWFAQLLNLDRDA